MNRILSFRCILPTTVYTLPMKGWTLNSHNVRNFAAKKGALSGVAAKIAGQMVQKKKLPVEIDPYKLVNYVCGSNIFKEGEDIQLKDDKEYPDWLWTLRLGPPPPLEEMDPNTLQYWKRLEKLGLRRMNRLRKGRV